MLAIVFALLAAFGNAAGSVLQRFAARTVPTQDRLRLRLIGLLIRRRAWLGGVGLLVCAGVLQALALYRGGLALVQPIAVAELPLALMISGRVFRGALGARAWVGILGMTGGLALVLFALAPSNPAPASPDAQGRPTAWLAAVAGCVVGMGILVLLARGADGNTRCASLAAAAGLGFGLTAALMKAVAVRVAVGGAPAALTSWQPYGMLAAGAGAFFLYQHAVHAGPLVASQPPVTILDPVVSVALGVLVFGESIRTGGWLLLAGVGGVLICAGTVGLSRSPLLSAEAR